MVKIGPHVVVYGPTGSGKTTVASRIAQHIGVPHIELDSVIWLPDWTQKPPAEFRADVSALLEKHTDGWVFDGVYPQARELTLPLADTVVWLRPPYPAAFWRLLKRTIIRLWKHEPLWGTNRVSWRQSFFSRHSLLLYQLTHWRRSQEWTRQALEEIPHQAVVYELRSTWEIEAFLSSFRHTA